MNRAPKKLLESLPEFSVTLKHIQIRREKGLITATLDPSGKGSSYKYDPTESLVYTVATILEGVGYNMDRAFNIARKAVSHCFIASMISKDFVWHVDINGGKGEFTDTAKFSEIIPPELGLDPDNFCKMSPKPGVFLFLPKGVFAELERHAGHIYSVAYRNISAIIVDACERLKLTPEEIEELEKACRRNEHIRLYGTANIEKYDFG